jgi:uncharacterized protein
VISTRVNTLLAAGADANAAMKDGGAALMFASQNGHLEVARALLAAKANVNAARKNGRTALMAASQNGHLKVVGVLLAAKAEVHPKALIEVSSGGHLKR